MKKINKLLLFLFTVIAGTACQEHRKMNEIFPLKNGETYTVWLVLHLMLQDSIEIERDELQVNTELVSMLGTEGKAVIAAYSTFLPDYLLDGETESNLAQALGDYETLKEAQDDLRNVWFDERLQPLRGYPGLLQIRKAGNTLFFERANRTDKFKIQDRKLVYLHTPEPLTYIPYDRGDILHKSHIHEIRLNGEKIEFTWWFLDPDNIESVAVNPVDHIVYITQKNKNPEYFTLSDLEEHLPYMVEFKAESLDEVGIITIRDKTTKDYTHDFSIYDKVETSAIKSLASGIIDGFDIKEIQIIIKD